MSDYIHHPWDVRNQSVGLCALTAKLGGVTTMGLEVLASLWAPAPTLVMGVTASLAGGLALGLPETLNTRCVTWGTYYDTQLTFDRLPDTLEEAESIGRKREDS